MAFSGEQSPGSLQVNQPSDRVTLGIVDTGATLSAQFNPTEFTEKVKPMWVKILTLGNTYEITQYTGTENYKIKFDLAFSAFDRHGTKLDDIQKARRFLLACCYPSRKANTIAGAKPRVLFVWPTMVSFTGIMADLEIKHTDFNRQMTSTRFVATISLEQLGDARIYAEDIQESGMLRVGAGGVTANTATSTSSSRGGS
jgi:hypothetical protein